MCWLLTVILGRYSRTEIILSRGVASAKRIDYCFIFVVMKKAILSSVMVVTLYDLLFFE